MDIVMIRQEMLLLTPGTRWTLPDEMAVQLIDRGSAEATTGAEPKLEIKTEKKGKGKSNPFS